MVITCTDCYGKSDLTECTQCKGQGMVYTDVSVHVSVPPGITNGNTLRLQGMGNYAGSFMGFADQHTDAYCHVAVIPDPDLTIDGQSVVSRLNISLSDALKGCQRIIKTIHGDRGIKINPRSKNAQEVIIPHCGVGGSGNQRVILDIDYPSDIDKLIKFLDEV
jgi:molecular chaperone DnaJ